MASSIDATKPTAGAALTADVRNNFSAAKTEIEALQADAAVHVSAADPHPGYALDADLTAGLATKLNLTGGTLSGWLKMAVGSGHYLYNLDTDASNYERGFVRWNANVLEIGTEAGGTGAVRALALYSLGGYFITQSGSGGATRARIWNANNTATVDFYPSRSGAAIATMEAGHAVIGIGPSDGAYVHKFRADGSMEFSEVSAPAAPATNNVRIYAEDNGAGKTRLMARFATGAAVQVAIEP